MDQRQFEQGEILHLVDHDQRVVLGIVQGAIAQLGYGLADDVVEVDDSALGQSCLVGLIEQGPHVGPLVRAQGDTLATRPADRLVLLHGSQATALDHTPDLVLPILVVGVVDPAEHVTRLAPGAGERVFVHLVVADAVGHAATFQETHRPCVQADELGTVGRLGSQP